MHTKACIIAAALLCPMVWAQTVAIPPGIDASFVHYTRFATELSPILKEVKDKESADKAAALLKEKIEEAYILSKEIAQYDKLPADVIQAITDKHGKTMRTEWGKLYEEIFRLQKAQCYASLPFAQQFQALCTIFNQ